MTNFSLSNWILARLYTTEKGAFNQQSSVPLLIGLATSPYYNKQKCIRVKECKLSEIKIKVMDSWTIFKRGQKGSMNILVLVFLNCQRFPKISALGKKNRK